MNIYVYGEKRKLPAGFEEFVDPAHTAVISIDMHRGHLSDSADCPVRLRVRARSLLLSIDFTTRRVGWAFRLSM